MIFYEEDYDEDRYHRDFQLSLRIQVGSEGLHPPITLLKSKLYDEGSFLLFKFKGVEEI